MEEKPVKLMVMGETCSYATVPVAQMAPYFNLVQLTPTSDSPELANRDRFKTMFRLLPDAPKAYYPIADICRHFNWSHVALVRHSIPYFYETANLLEEHLQRKNISILSSEAVSDDLPVSQVDNLKRKDVRIIIYVGYEKPFRALLCQAYRSGLYGPLYQWLSTAFYDQGWLDVPDTPCTPAQLREVANLTLGGLHVMHDLTGRRGVSGRTYAEYEKLYRLRTHFYNQCHAFGYDTIWTIALALNNSLTKVHSQGEVSFGVDGGRVAEVTQIVQIQLDVGDQFVLVGYHYEGGDRLDFNVGRPLKWRGEGPPFDVIKLRIIKVHLEPAFLPTVAILAGCGTVFAISFLIFNCINKKEKLIKMSSPRLNNVIAVGCIFAYVTVVVNGLDGRWLATPVLPKVMCMPSVSFLMVAFTLAFGAMFAKTWRVYSIIREKTGVSNKPLHDHHLLAFVGLLLGVDFVVILIWNVVEPPQLVAYNGTKTESKQFADLEQTDTCYSDHYVYWCGGILVWKGIFLLGGCFLAFETRNVHIAALNDSRYVGMSVYNTIVMCVVGVTVNLAIRDQRTLTASFTVGTIFFAATFVLALLFIPKVVDLRRQAKLQLRIKSIRTDSTSSIWSISSILSISSSLASVSPVFAYHGDDPWREAVCDVCKTRNRSAGYEGTCSGTPSNGRSAGNDDVKSNNDDINL